MLRSRHSFPQSARLCLAPVDEADHAGNVGVMTAHLARPGSGEPLGFGHRARLQRLLRRTPRSPSEYALANLLGYRGRHNYRLIDGQEPCLLGVTYDGECHALPLCPLDAGSAARMLGHADCIYPLAEEEAQRLAAGSVFRIDDCGADADYVYDCAALSRLTGAKTRRAQAAAFAALGPRLAAFAPAQARELLRGWLDQAGRGPDHADAHECGEAIERFADIELDGVTVLLGNKPMGFLLASPESDDERVVHFAKGRRDVVGVYPWMFAQFAAIAGASRLNFEQDLGLPGLAQAKQALAPMERRRKFRLRKP